MEIYFFLSKIILISAITLLLIIKGRNYKVEYFPQQTWSIREVLPFYWAFTFIIIFSVILYKANPSGHLYISTSYMSTFLAGFILFLAIKKIMVKKRISPLSSIGAKSSDIYWVLSLIAIQFSLLSVILYSRNWVGGGSHVFWMLGHFSITLIFWPIFESVFYLGMMFIPTTRIVGLVKGAFLISLLQALSHFNYNSIEVVINFALFGLLGCYLYIKSKRIIVPLSLHSAINFFVLLRSIKFFG
jgi:membrane protease YdiL (CAAX protease family)